VYHGNTVGQLILGPRARGETFSPADRHYTCRSCPSGSRSRTCHTSACPDRAPGRRPPALT
jgi:hypothetical protein